MNFFEGYVLKKKNNIYLNKNIAIPKLKKNQLLIKIKYTSICGSQIFEISGLRGKDAYLPHLLGHEGAGIVVDKHKSVKKVNINDEVILTWIKGKGGEGGGIILKDENDKAINAGPITTFSNYSIISENRVIKKPKSMDMKIASLFGCCIPTGFGMALNYFKINQKVKVMIIGLGGIGFSSLIMAHSLNPNKIIILDNDINKIKNVKKLGFSHSYHVDDHNLKKLKNNIKSMDIDFCIESSGTTKMIEFAIEVISNRGKVVFASHPKNNQKIKIDPHDLIKGKKIFGSWGGGSKLDFCIEEYWKVFKNSSLSSNLFSNKFYKFKELKLAISDMKSKKVLRPIIKL